MVKPKITGRCLHYEFVPQVKYKYLTRLVSIMALFGFRKAETGVRFPYKAPILTYVYVELLQRLGNLNKGKHMFAIILILAIIGVLLWLINAYVPMDGKIKKILNIVVVIGVILWLLNVVGVFGYLKSVPAPHVQMTSAEMI